MKPLISLNYKNCELSLYCVLSSTKQILEDINKQTIQYLKQPNRGLFTYFPTKLN